MNEILEKYFDQKIREAFLYAITEYKPKKERN